MNWNENTFGPFGTLKEAEQFLDWAAKSTNKSDMTAWDETKYRWAKKLLPDYKPQPKRGRYEDEDVQVPCQARPGAADC